MKAFIFASVLLITGCCGQKETAQVEEQAGTPTSSEKPTPAYTPDLAATARVVVYRTRRDLQDHVPVMLSEDGTDIASYPDPKDLRTPDGPPVPTKLAENWLLDRRGIGPHTAFLEMTYAEYAALDEPPSMIELAGALEDRTPITEMCDCGPRSAFTDEVAELDRIIRNDSIYIRCKRLK